MYNQSHLGLWGICSLLVVRSLAASPDTPVLSPQRDLEVKRSHINLTWSGFILSICTYVHRLYCNTTAAKHISLPLRPCLRTSLSWMKPVNICVSMKTSRNLLKLFEVTALRKASRWKDEDEEDEGLGKVGDETDSSSLSAPPMKRE